MEKHNMLRTILIWDDIQDVIISDSCDPRLKLYLYGSPSSDSRVQRYFLYDKGPPVSLGLSKKHPIITLSKGTLAKAAHGSFVEEVIHRKTLLPSCYDAAIGGLLTRDVWPASTDHEALCRTVSHQLALSGWKRDDTQKFFATLHSIVGGPDLTKAVSDGYDEFDSGSIKWNNAGLAAVIGWDAAGAISRWAFDREHLNFSASIKAAAKERERLHVSKRKTLVQTVADTLQDRFAFLTSGDLTKGWDLGCSQVAAEQVVSRACSEFLFQHTAEVDINTAYGSRLQALLEQDEEVVAMLCQEMRPALRRSDLSCFFTPAGTSRADVFDDAE